MEIKLKFNITLVSGEQTEQVLTFPADPNKAFDAQALFFMQQALAQYSTIGMLRQPEKGTFVLLCPSQIAMVAVSLPTIVIAGASEVPNVTLD